MTEKGVTTGFVSVKTAAIAYYLAATAREHNRPVLATLFWPESTHSQALKNLRDAVSNLRQLLDPHLAITRKTMGLNTEIDYHVDVLHFDALLAQARNHSSPASDVPSAEETNLLREAVALYGGEFFEGVYLDDAPEMEAWVRDERTRYHQLVQQALHRLIEASIAQKQYLSAIDYATRRLAMEPLEEETHRQLMRIYAASGQYALALAQYEQCCSILYEELGSEPAAETTALFEHIGARQARPASLHVPSTAPLVGRQRELDEIERWLAQSQGRLITLTGLGGVGKTQLALHVLKSYGARYADGAYFVSLESLDSPEQLHTAVGAATGAPFAPGERTDVQLMNYLRNKEVLLVLDNFETVYSWSSPDASTQLLLALLEEAPRLCLLVTSREPLHLRWERVINLTGLETPPEAAVSHPAAAFDELAHYDAVRLFLRTARRVHARFAGWGNSADHHENSTPAEQGQDAIDPAELQAIVRICRLVDGLPLAIEVAAGWVQTLSCQEIVDEIERSMDFLQTQHRDTPARHRSLRAVFDHTWSRLSPSEQAILRKLVVFRGGFSRDAAQRVADASLTLLSTLTHKSLVRRGDDNRYHLYELLRQYVLEHQAGDASANTAAQHAEHYMALLQEQAVDTESPQAAAAVRTIGQEIDNVRAAWQWAIQNGHWTLVDRGLPGLFMLYRFRNWHQEGEAVFHRASSSLLATSSPAPAPSSAPLMPLLQTRLNICRATFAYHLGHLQDVRRLLDESNELLKITPDDVQQAFCLHGLAAVATAQGAYGEAYAHALQSLKLYQTLDAPARQAQVLSLLGEIQLQRGKYDEAVSHLDAALALARSHHFAHIEANGLRHLGRICWNRGDYVRARLQFDRAITLYGLDNMRDALGEAAVRNELGFMAWSQGDGTEAALQHGRALEIFLQVGDRKGEATTLSHLGRLAEKQKDFATARSHYQRALQIARSIGDRQNEGNVLTELGFLSFHQDDHESARSYFQQSREIYQDSGHRRGEGLALACLGLIHVLWREYAQARQHSREALELTQAIGDAPVRGYALTHLGHALAGLERWTEAESVYAEAVELRRSLGDLDRALEPLAGLAHVAFAEANQERAAGLVDEILRFLENGSLERLLFPVWVYWICYRVLHATGDPRTTTVRETLLRHLEQHSTPAIPPTAQPSFSVPVYQDIALALAQDRA